MLQVDVRRGDDVPVRVATDTGRHRTFPDSPHWADRSALWVLAMGVLVSGLVPAALFHATAGGAAEAYPGLLAVMVVAGMRFAWIIGSPNRHLYEMVIWVFTYVFLGMAPFVQLRLGVEPETTRDLHPQFVPIATLVVLVGSLAIIAGSYFGGSHQPATHREFRLDAHRVELLAIAALVLGSYYAATIGLGNTFVSLARTAWLRQMGWSDPTVSALVYGGSVMALLVAAISLTQVIREGMGGGRTRFLQIAVFVILFVVANPVNSARYVFGSVFLGLLAAFGLYATVARFRAAAAGAMAGMVIVFPAADAFRYTTDASIEVQNPLLSLTGGDYDGFSQIVNTVQYVSAEGLTGGRQLLGALLFWIPRGIWTDKPVDTGAMLAEFKDYSFTNLSEPLWGEFFIDFGWVGLVVGMFLVGLLARRLDHEVEADLRVRAAPGVLSCIMPFYLLIILRGSLLQSMAFITVAVVCTIFIQRLPRRRRSGSHQPTPSRISA